MNREQRRNMHKDPDSSLRYLQTPCTITEATQIARGVSEDVVSEYASKESPLKVAMSLQIEILKDVVMRSGLITEDEFRSMYMQKAEEFNQKQKEMMELSHQDNPSDNSNPKVSAKAGDVEITKMED